MKTAALLTFILPLFAVPAGAAEVPWTLDKAHAEIGFSVRHLGITNVRGKFSDFDAQITADEATGKISAFTATAKAASVTTNNEQRDGHLKTDDFFNVEAYPVLTMKSKSFKWDGKKVTAVVDLTIRDKTKSVTLTGELLGPQKANFGQGMTVRAGYLVKGKINRKDFGLKFNMVAEGMAVVSEDVELILEIEMYRKA